MEIARVGVEESELLLHRSDDARVRVADKRNVVVDVEEGAAGVVVKILAPASNDLERMAVGNAEIPAEELLSGGERGVERRLERRETIFGNAQNEIGIGREAGEEIALGGKGNARKIGGEVEKIENDLEVKMGRPAAVFGSSADAGEKLAAGDAVANAQWGERDP